MQIEIEKHPALVEAVREYMQAVRARRAGYICNAARQRDYLRSMYHLIAGK